MFKYECMQEAGGPHLPDVWRGQRLGEVIKGLDLIVGVVTVETIVTKLHDTRAPNLSLHLAHAWSRHR